MIEPAESIAHRCGIGRRRCAKQPITTMVLVLLSGAFLCGQHSSTTGNAALKYLRGYAAIHQGKAIPDVRPLIENYRSVSLDENAASTINAAERGLQLVKSGVLLRDCDWGVAIDEGVDANTSHRGVVREITALLGLRFRLRMADGLTVRRSTICSLALL